MRLLLTVFLVAVIVHPLAATAADEEVKAKVKEFQTAMKSSDAGQRRSAVESMATIQDPSVALALAKFLGDRDPAVRGAVGRALGQQGEMKYRGKLVSRVNDKEDPKAVIGFCAGLELLPDKKSADPLADYIKKVMYGQKKEQLEAGIAAAKALGKIKHKSAVDALIDLIGLVNPRAGSGGAAVSNETRAFRGAFKEPIIEGLGDITKQRFKDPAVWQGWWKDVEKRFKVPTGEEDLNADPVYQDFGYKFRLKKPNKSWIYSRPTAGNYIIELGHPQENNAAINDAGLSIEAFNQADYSDSSPAARLAYWDDWAQTTGFKDIKETNSKDVSFAGEKAKYWMAKGMTTAGTVWTYQKYIFAKDGLLWTVHLKMLSGVPKTLEKDLEKAAKTFTLLK